jgi:hypothetical protein
MLLVGSVVFWFVDIGGYWVLLGLFLTGIVGGIFV